MAAYTTNFSVHKTLAANTADTVTFTSKSGRVIVVNRGTTEIYFSVLTSPSGTAATVAGNDTYVVPGPASFDVPLDYQNYYTISLISSGATAYSVILA